MEKNIQIVIIDDDKETNSRPFYLKLSNLYGTENIIWKEDPRKGIEFIKQNLTKRTIVLLDYHFGTGNTNGFKLFQELQEESSLLYIIIYTAQIDLEIPPKELIYCINNHLMAYVDKTNGYPELLNQVELGIKNLNNRVDCILEEWILRHEKFKRETPYIKDENGKPLNLNDVLSEIRKDTPLGKKMANNIISTAISMMQKDIDKLEK